MADIERLLGAAGKAIININLPSKEFLDLCSYRCSFGKSLNKLPVTDELVRCIMSDIQVYNTMLEGIDDINDFPFRVKTADSIYRKLERHPDLRAQSVFNDILGLRIVVDCYQKEYPEYFRVVDMSNGKTYDDGYRAVHLYYKRDNFSYPIEIQLWSKYDATFNNWMHRKGYKTVESSVLKSLRSEYECGYIHCFEEYERRLGEYAKES